MTREQVIKLFPDATDDQITALLNQNNSEVAREKEKASGYKENEKTARNGAVFLIQKHDLPGPNTG